jgi:protein BCP1
MGKKRSRDTDGQGDVSMADPAVEKRDEDSSDDDEVRRNPRPLSKISPTDAIHGNRRTWTSST